MNGLLRGADPFVVLPIDFLAFARAIESCYTSGAAFERLREDICDFWQVVQVRVGVEGASMLFESH